jgi:hypothetical protein
MGQQRSVMVFRLVARATVEERMLQVGGGWEGGGCWVLGVCMRGARETASQACIMSEQGQPRCSWDHVQVLLPQAAVLAASLTAPTLHFHLNPAACQVQDGAGAPGGGQGSAC